MTELDKWHPKPKQRKVLEAALTPEYNRTITAICEEAGIKRQTFYNWIKKDEKFREAWNKVWEWSIDRYMPGMVSAQVKKALTGDTAAAKYLSELSGRMVKNVDIKSGGEIIKAYVGISPDDWDKEDE